MNETECKAIIEFVIESLVKAGYIKQSTYGQMPASWAGDLAEELAKKIENDEL